MIRAGALSLITAFVFAQIQNTSGSGWVAVLAFVGGISATELVKRILFKSYGSDHISAAMQLELRKAMQEIVTTHIAPILQNQTEALRTLVSINQGIRDSLSELAGIERNRGM